MAKKAVIRKRNKLPPTMIAMFIKPQAGLMIQTSLLAFAGGYADHQHYETLAEVADHLMIGTEGKDEGAQGVAHGARLALMNVADRYRRTKKIGASGDELKMLRALVEISDDFWNRQSGAHFMRAKLAMESFRKESHG